MRVTRRVMRRKVPAFYGNKTFSLQRRGNCVYLCRETMATPHLARRGDAGVLWAAASIPQHAAERAARVVTVVKAQQKQQQQ
ncbi:hypothetical protein O3P69_004121 [Scylla paramamosain]|uniref:Uncharacterized protein n=1 Tax=Scylla paramamosain TaxID=85552 RepID=A0AAW0UF71_SCYPA